jgi:pyruvate/2-oxoglutarate dehydrogenase complex dihydrolipoamide dehydrogenase (E3) component
MNNTIETDIAIIGGGAGGLSVAAGGAQMGAKVVLIEANKMGGDCLNYGCVPSKALLASAKTAQTIRDAASFGLPTRLGSVDNWFTRCK